MSKKILVWTDNDLDGIVSALIIKWLHPKDDITFEEVFEGNFESAIKKREKELKSFDIIYITDIYVPDNVYRLVDLPNVIILDHHKTHSEIRPRYIHAKTHIEIGPSAAKLIYDWNPKCKDFTPQQKALVVFANDYDSYTLKHKESLCYHIITKTYNAPKIAKFIEAFIDGHRKFNIQEQNMISLYIKKYKDQLSRLEPYVGELNGNKVVAVQADFAINEIAHQIIKKYDADVAIIINVKYKVVSFRKKLSCNVELDKWATKLCNGGGHNHAAGGKLTDTFLNFTKILKKL